MPAFYNEADLRRAIAIAGFDDIADRMVATARPALLFVRRQLPDDPLPPGASKIGGLPDLPPGFAWPYRPPAPNADRREREVRERYPVSARQEPASEFDIAADRYANLLIAACRRAFPLAFRAQVDLARLAREPGFDSDLPRNGALSIFEDPTGNGIRTFWHDMAADTLVRHQPPDDLVALSDAYFGDQTWAELDRAEILVPHSALTLAHHWIEAAGDRWGEMYDLIHEPTHAFFPSQDEGDDVAGGNFGDRLGGWPDPIQKDPEREFAGRSQRPTAPWDNAVRHLFTWGGEYYGGTRLPDLEKAGDGLTHVLIARDALLARRFEAAGAVISATDEVPKISCSTSRKGAQSLVEQRGSFAEPLGWVGRNRIYLPSAAAPRSTSSRNCRKLTGSGWWWVSKGWCGTPYSEGGARKRLHRHLCRRVAVRRSANETIRGATENLCLGRP